MSRCNEPIEITNKVELDNQTNSCGFNQTLDDYLTSIKRSALLGCTHESICDVNRFTVSYRIETPELIRYDIKDHVLGVEETIFHMYVEGLDTPSKLFGQIVKQQRLANDRIVLGDFTKSADLSNTQTSIYSAVQRLNGLVLISKTDLSINVNLSIDYKLTVTEGLTIAPDVPAEWVGLIEHYRSPKVAQSFKLLYRTIQHLRRLAFEVVNITKVSDNHSYKIQMWLPLSANLGLNRTLVAELSYTSEVDLELKNKLEELQICRS